MSAIEKDWPTGPMPICWIGIVATWRLGCLGMMIWQKESILAWPRFLWRFSVQTFWWWRLGDLTSAMRKLNPRFEAECARYFGDAEATKTLPSGQAPAALP